MTPSDVKRLFDVVIQTGRMRSLEVHAVLDVFKGLWKERAEARADIAYLAARADWSGRCSCGPDRDFGIASDALVRLAYGGVPPRTDEMPREREDYAACLRAVERLPAHRRTGVVMEALRRIEVEQDRRAEARRGSEGRMKHGSTSNLKGGNDDT